MLVPGRGGLAMSHSRAGYGRGASWGGGGGRRDRDEVGSCGGGARGAGKAAALSGT